MAQIPQAMTLKALLENPDLLNPPKPNEGSDKLGKKNGDDLEVFNSQSAFLVPSLWEKTLPFDGNDFKLEFMDLDEFLNENQLPTTDDAVSPKDDIPQPQLQQQPMSPPVQVQPTGLVNSEQFLNLAGSPQSPTGPSVVLPQSPVSVPAGQMSPGSRMGSSPGSPVSGDIQVDFSLPVSDTVLATIPGEETFDPRRRQFSEEELRPQPMIKKSRKIFVPDELKDDKYWSRRNKNNAAAKRSRDARRIKENQIALRASYLERENEQLKAELEKTRRENKELKKRVSSLEGSVNVTS